MNRRWVTLIPILLGGAAGALMALFEAFPSGAPGEVAQPSAEAAVRRPNARPMSTARATPSVAAAISEAPPTASAAAVTTAAAAPSASATSSNAPSASAASAPPPKRAFDLSEPATAETLLAAQVQCNRSSPEDCERAALALESGSLGVKDPPRAQSLRRIALTLYVKQCESGRAIACTRLAEMYEVGEIVQPNPRSAQALRTRVTALCAKRPSEPGCLP